MAILNRELTTSGLEVRLDDQGGRAVVAAWGELDISSAKEFEDKLHQATKGNAFGIIVDLVGVTFIDSAGLRVLISAAAMAHGTGRELIVLRASDQVKQVIEVSGVEDLLPVAD